jgi:hypothetical protein
MIKSSDLLIFLEKTNFSNRFSIRYLINSSHHLNFYHCNASSIYFLTETNLNRKKSDLITKSDDSVDIRRQIFSNDDDI